jgi:hypothetical protein
VSDSDSIDPEKFRLDPATITKSGKAPRRSQSLFTKMPKLWVEQLAGIQAHGSTYRVALFLLHEVWKTGNRVVKLTNIALAKAKVGREGKAVALRELRKAGLVSVEQRPNRNPIVTVRFPD